MTQAKRRADEEGLCTSKGYAFVETTSLDPNEVSEILRESAVRSGLRWSVDVIKRSVDFVD